MERDFHEILHGSTCDTGVTLSSERSLVYWRSTPSMELLTVIAIEDSRGAATRQQCILCAAEEGATTHVLIPL